MSGQAIIDMRPELADTGHETNATLRLKRNGNVFPFGSTPLWISRSPKRVRVIKRGNVLADTRRALLLHEEGKTPVYYFHPDDIEHSLMRRASNQFLSCRRKGRAAIFHCAQLGETSTPIAWSFDAPVEAAEIIAGYFAFVFDAVDQWFEDGDEIFGSPPDPFVRVDVRSVTGTVTIFHEGVTLARSNSALIVYETGLVPRFYIPSADVCVTLEPSSQTSHCVYKGKAVYRNITVAGSMIEDSVWGYPEPIAEVSRIAGHWCFEFERFEETRLDGQKLLPPIGRADGRPVLSRGDVSAAIKSHLQNN